MNKRRSFSLIICIALCVLGLAALMTFVVDARPAGAARALSLTVTNTDDGGPGSLRQAIADAGPGDSIDFALSYPATITLTSGELLITKPLTITGPGPALLAISGDHASRVFRVDDPAGAEQIAVTLSGLTIADGQVGESEDGGGLWNDEGLKLSDVTFRSNSAGGHGGGMYNDYYASPTLTNVTVHGNSANSGGGMHNNWHSAPILTNVTFNGNSAARGGGIFNGSCDPTLIHVTFHGNSASWGGGMCNEAWSSPTLTDVTFDNNSATASGGGIENYYESSPTLTNVTFRGNSAGGRGGGIMNNNSSSRLTNATFSGNSAGLGGGIYNGSGGSRLTNATFSGNSAGFGGGIYNGSNYLTIRNSIMWGNRAASGGDQIYNGGSMPDIAHSNVQGSGGSGPGWDPGLGSDLGGNLDADPRFVDPVDPAVAPTAAANLHLRWGSPAVDAGDNGLVSPGVTTDLDGAPRIVYDTVDMGAYEFQPGLYLYKDAALDRAAPGQPFAYTLQAINAFTATAMTGGLISDTLPAGLVFAGPITLEPPGAGVVGAAPPILVSDLTLNPGQGVTVTLPVDVASGVALGTLLTNTASIHSQQVVEPRWASHNLLVCAAHLTVVSAADSGPGSLRQAIADVCPGGSVDFALAYPATLTLTSGELRVDKPLTLAGPGPELLAISGDHTSRVFRVERLLGVGQIAVTLSGLTVRDGYISGNGGGLWNVENLILTNVTFNNNSAGRSGGGMYNEYSNPTLTNVTFSGNSAHWNGGGLYGDYSNSTLTDVTFSGNLAFYSGGGIYNDDSSPTLTDVTFSDNSAYLDGGGIFGHRSNLALTNVTFSANSARSGGGIYNRYGSPRLTNVTFSANSTQQDGGGMYSYSSSPTLTNVTFNDNSANQYGGGMYNSLRNPTIQNSILWGNRAAAGGDQIYNDNSTPAIAHSNVQGSGGSGPGWDPSLGNDLGGNLDADPRFVGAAGNLRLRWGSPAIDAGDNSLVPPGVTTDLDGAPRFAYGTVDMGAYELQPGLYLYKEADVVGVVSGQRLTYTLQAANAFTATAMTGGLISDSLPAGLLFAGPITLEPPGAGLVGAAPPILVSDLTLSPTQIVTVTFPVTVTPGLAAFTILTNSAALTSSQVLTPQWAHHTIVVVGYYYLPVVLRSDEP